MDSVGDVDIIFLCQCENLMSFSLYTQIISLSHGHKFNKMLQSLKVWSIPDYLSVVAVTLNCRDCNKSQPHDRALHLLSAGQLIYLLMFLQTCRHLTIQGQQNVDMKYSTNDISIMYIVPTLTMVIIPELRQPSTYSIFQASTPGDAVSSTRRSRPSRNLLAVPVCTEPLSSSIEGIA